MSGEWDLGGGGGLVSEGCVSSHHSQPTCSGVSRLLSLRGTIIQEQVSSQLSQWFPGESCTQYCRNPQLNPKILISKKSLKTKTCSLYMKFILTMVFSSRDPEQRSVARETSGSSGMVPLGASQQSLLQPTLRYLLLTRDQHQPRQQQQPSHCPHLT